MKLNHDCVRDLLLFLEGTLNFDQKPLDVRKISLKKQSSEDIRYSALKLLEAGYISAQTCVLDGEREIYIREITWEGHKFLDNVRDPAVWKHSKSVLSKFLSTSIGIVENVSAQVITNLIEKELSLNPIQ